jgi:hypothetical protein
MNRRIATLSCLFGILALLSACLTPVGTTTTGLDGAVAASPVPQDTKEDSPEGEGTPRTEFPIEVAKEAKDRAVAEASPPWMAPTDGFIGCIESLWADAAVSLEGGKTMLPEDLEVALKVRNPETGEEEDTADHSLTVEVKVSLPEDLFRDLGDALRGGSLRRIGEGDETAGEETASGPTSLRVSLKLTSTRPSDPTVRDACAPEIAYMRSKTFVLQANYRRRLVPYSGEKDFQLAPDQMFTGLDKLILTAHPLLAPDRVLKGRLIR